jgi:hypothetical protein
MTDNARNWLDWSLAAACLTICADAQDKIGHCLAPGQALYAGGEAEEVANQAYRAFAAKAAPEINTQEVLRMAAEHMRLLAAGVKP